MIKSILNFLVILALAVIGIVGINMIKKNRLKLESRGEVVSELVKTEVHRVGSKVLDNTIVARGVTESVRTMRVSSEIAGKVIYVNPKAEFGETIAESEVLVKLDTTLLELEADRLKATIATTKIAVDTAELEISRITNSLAAAVETLKTVQKIFDRNLKLFESMGLAENQMDLSRIDLIKAKNAVSAAKDGLNLAKAQFERAKSELSGLNVQIKTINERISKAVIVAPMRGVISARNCELGENVAPTSPLFVLQSCDNLYFTAMVPAQYFVQIVRDQAVSIRLFDYDVVEISGKVSRLGIDADPRTRAYQVKILFDNSKLNLRPGMFGEARICLPEVKFEVTAPSRSILNDGGKPYVFRIVNGVAEIAYIEIAKEIMGYVNVISGLTAGDVIAVSAFDKLSPGARIEEVNLNEQAVDDGEQK